MRPQNHLYLPDNDLKQMWLDVLVKIMLLWYLMTDNKYVDMWRQNGLTTFQVAQGDF